MPKKYSDEAYYKQLPKKQVGTAVLFFNTKGELLVVKPDYKDSWLVPGGSADENESPSHCARRETMEEVGLTIKKLTLVGIYYAPAKNIHTDSLKFIFDAGTIDETEISKIKIQADEIEKYMFLPLEEALKILSGSLQESIPMCMEAIRNKNVAYRELGSTDLFA
jgi:8-oxo-dGTP diphosphatase